jgi:predicted ATPase/DNA-binding CsgD family transcriptional regulator
MRRAGIHQSHNLPAQHTRLIGRDADLVAVRQVILGTEGRLVTLTGAGGCGKTRLGLHVATDLVAAFRDGVWLVELAPLADASLVLPAVAAALGVREQPGRPILDSLKTRLKAKRLLIVLDNCEHLVKACAVLADALLGSSPNVRVLATSREALGVHGEITWRVPSLAVPPLDQIQLPEDLARWPSVQLFMDRAQAARQGFELTHQNATAVAHICARLDGLPLAIELAAARVRMFGAEQILKRLDDGMRLLVGGSRTAPSRQQTLRATLDWSHALLVGHEPTVFRRLAVFARGFSLEAAETVCSGDGVESVEVLGLLSGLFDKSLVAAEHQQERVRYRLLEPIRQYANTQLEASGELLRLQRRHATFFLGFAQRWERDSNVGGPRRPVAQLALALEQDNLRAALAWCLSCAEADMGLRLASAQTHLWLVRANFGEARAWLEQVLALPGASDPTATRAAVQIVLGHIYSTQGNYTAAHQLYAEALPIAREAGDSWLLYSTLVDLGYNDLRRGDFGAAQQCMDEALAATRAGNDPVSEAMALALVGDVAFRRGDLATARARGEEGVALARAADDRWHLTHTLKHLGWTVLHQGQVATACELFEEAESLFSEQGDQSGRAYTLAGLGLAALSQGHFREAQALLGEALIINHELGEQRGVAERFEEIAALAAAQAQPERALRLLGAGAAMRESIGAGPLDNGLLNQWLGPLWQVADKEFAARATAIGRAMPVDQAISLANGEPEPALSLPRESALLVVNSLPLPLTPREQEVAALLAEGLSNHRIAEALVITQRTVAAHIEHILTKLDFTSRTQIALWAAEHGLAVTNTS